MNMGHRLKNDLAVLYLTSQVVYPPVSEYLPVAHIEGRRSGLVNEYHLGVLDNHCLVEHFLLGYSCYVAVVNQAQYWVKLACLSAVGLTDKAWHSPFVLLLVEIQQPHEIFAKQTNLVFYQAVFKTPWKYLGCGTLEGS